MKVPAHDFDSTVAFYRDILGLEQANVSSPDVNESIAFKFGDKNLWIDRVAGISQAELWLEIDTDDVDKASTYFAANSCIRRDEIEPLPEGFKGFWISSPCNIIHLING